MAGARTRVAVAVDEGLLSAWRRAVIQSLLGEGSAEVVGVIVVPRASAATCAPKLVRAALQVWSVGERRLGRSRLPDPLDAGALPRRLRRLTPEGSRDIGGLDVIVDLVSTTSAPGLPPATYGTWRLFIGNTRLLDERLAGVGEVLDRRAYTEVSVRAEQSFVSPTVVARSIAATRSTPTSNRDAVLWRATDMFSHGVRRIAAGGPAVVGGSAGNEGRQRVGRRAPSVTSLLVSAARLAQTTAARQARHLWYREVWQIAFRASHERALSTQDAAGLRVVEPPRSFVHADPFVLEIDTRHVVLFEMYDRRTRRAAIAAATIEGDSLSTPRIVLESDYHLSYPFVFRDGDGIWMIPESTEARKVQLFRAVDFPTAWELDAVLLEGVEACDPTVFHDGIRYWLFAAVPRPGVWPHEELRLYSSAHLRGPYEPHPANPVVADIRSARPAGALFFRDGKLYRPSQDCAQRYGFAIQINEVVRLTPSEYEERRVSRIGPGWCSGGRGTHTTNHDGAYEVLDVLTLKRRLRVK